MKLSAVMTALFLIISINSAVAITEITNSEQAEKMNLQSMGITASTVRVDTLDEAVKALGEKAEKQGAEYFRVIGARSFDTSPYWRVSVEMYKK